MTSLGAGRGQPLDTGRELPAGSKLPPSSSRVDRVIFNLRHLRQLLNLDYKTMRYVFLMAIGENRVSVSKRLRISDRVFDQAITRAKKAVKLDRGRFTVWAVLFLNNGVKVPLLPWTEGEVRDVLKRLMEMHEQVGRKSG